MCLDAIDIVGEGLLIEKIALSTLHRRVANHSGSTSYKSVRFIAASLEVLEYHYADKMSYMKGISGRVNANIS